jgi:exodeoxyribonuclease VII small subunit
LRYFCSFLSTPVFGIALIMTKPAEPVKFSQPESFEAALAELESIVLEMEAGQMTLEMSLLAHKRGMELVQYCQVTLQDAQHQVRLLEANALRNFSPSGIDDR